LSFIFAVLLLKYCFPTGDQLERYCASDIFYSSQAAVTHYPMVWLNHWTKQTTRVSMTSPLACIADNFEQNSFYIHKMAI